MTFELQKIFRFLLFYVVIRLIMYKLINSGYIIDDVDMITILLLLNRHVIRICNIFHINIFKTSSINFITQ